MANLIKKLKYYLKIIIFASLILAAGYGIFKFVSLTAATIVLSILYVHVYQRTSHKATVKLILSVHKNIVENQKIILKEAKKRSKK